MIRYQCAMRHLVVIVLVFGFPTLPLLAQSAETAVTEAEAVPIELGTNVSHEDASSSPRSLGVIVTDSPGDGVLVTSVAWGGPASRAGIRAGDFILSVAGKVIVTPSDLREAVDVADSKAELDFGVWRNGKDIAAKVALASRFADAKREKAWLGVELQMSDGEKVLVADLMPMSPAARGGLRVGDAIVSVDAERINSVDELLQLMKRIKGGDNVEVTVLRDGTERTFTVRVGSVVQRTMRWFEERLPREEFQRPWFEFMPPDVSSNVNLESFEVLLDRLRDEVRELQEEVRRMRAGKAEEKAEADRPPQPQASPTDKTSASNQNPNVMTVAVRRPRSRSGANANRVRSYRNYRGGRPQTRYRYDYRRRNSNVGRSYYVRPGAYFYYGAPIYYSYPRAPYYYYGPRVGVYVGPRFYWY